MYRICWNHQERISDAIHLTCDGVGISFRNNMWFEGKTRHIKKVGWVLRVCTDSEKIWLYKYKWIWIGEGKQVNRYKQICGNTNTCWEVYWSIKRRKTIRFICTLYFLVLLGIWWKKKKWMIRFERNEKRGVILDFICASEVVVNGLNKQKDRVLGVGNG